MGLLDDWINNEARATAHKLADINGATAICSSSCGFGLRQRTLELLDMLKAALFPCVHEIGAMAGDFERLAQERLYSAARLIFDILKDIDTEERAEEATVAFMGKIVAIRETLSTDVEAAYRGDPAARGLDEILLSYPSIAAMSAYRVAHEFYLLGYGLVARIMTESAHADTGIDIHPGATIGKYFFIDHGTGVVIGETCVIGDNVKLYQGVTLGAKSFATDAEGNLVRGHKRHPNIEDNVVIYSGASILGGDVTVGRNSIIGGNAWIVKSVPENTLAYNPSPAVVTNTREGK